MSSPLIYQGDSGPELLTEPVVWKSTRWLLVPCAAFLGGLAGWTVALFAHLVFGLLTSNFAAISWHGWDLCAATVLGVLITGWFAWFRWSGEDIIVDREGVTRIRAGRKEFCRWQETTLFVNGTGTLATESLADRQGQPFNFNTATSKSPDSQIALNVVKTRVRELKRLRPAPPPRRSASLVVGTVMLLAFVAAFVAAPKTSLGEMFSSPDIPLSQKIAWLVVIFLACCGFLLLPLLLTPVEARLQAKAKEQARKKQSDLARFVEERQGRLEAVPFEEGIWYRPVGPKLWKDGSQFAQAVVLSVCSALLIGLVCLFFVSRTPASLLMLLFGPLLLPALIIVPVSAVGAIQQRRAATADIRKLDEGYELRFPNGRTITCKALKTPPQSRAKMTRYGYLSLVLRDGDRRVYRLDPRYLTEIH